MDIRSLVKIEPNPNIPPLAAGDTVKVSVKVMEAEKQRTQVFQGVVIRVRRGGNNASFTVRRVTHGTGVERTFMFHSPLVEKVQVVRHGSVRRARLYYLRGLSAREARFKERARATEEAVAGEVLLAAAPAEAAMPPAEEPAAEVRAAASGDASVAGTASDATRPE